MELNGIVFQDFPLMTDTQGSQNTLDGILHAISKCKVYLTKERILIGKAPELV